LKRSAAPPAVILDTNVFISAVLFKGATSRLVDLWQGGRISVLLSAEILKEYVRMLSTPKFKLTAPEIRSILEEALLPFATTVKPGKIRPIIAADPSDDKFLALAKAGRAAYLVSGDAHLLRLASYGKTKIIRPDAFLSLPV
jgi:putative PIN family toxin of toxin-antitoxin system